MLAAWAERNAAAITSNRGTNTVTDFQKRCAEVIRTKAVNQSMTVTELAWRLKTSRLAVTSAMRSLESKGLAGSFRGGNGDRWSGLYWFLRSKS